MAAPSVPDGGPLTEMFSRFAELMECNYIVMRGGMIMQWIKADTYADAERQQVEEGRLWTRCGD